MSKGVKIRIPKDRQDGEKARPDDGVYYLDHDQAMDIMRSMVRQIAVDRINGRGQRADYDALRSESRDVIADLKYEVRHHQR